MPYLVNHFINGKILSVESHTLPIHNPATSEIIGEVAIADQNVVNQAVSAAEQAFPAWSATPPLKRAKIFFKYKELLEKHLNELAEIVSREHGKTINDARGSIQRGLDLVDFVCGIPNLLKGRYSENIATDMDCYSIRQPLGVCVGITPFNFPAMIPLWMFPMAIACGNTFVLKPSEKDPSCSLRLMELLQAAGLPDGVVNVVQGDKTTVDSLVKHPAVKAVSFVGSTPVAESIFKMATSCGKRVQAFGGAKNHCVVMPDADLEQTADAIVGAAYGSAGERCMAISVAVVVGEKVADELVKKMITRIQNLKIGAGNVSDVDMGPLITAAHCERVKKYLEIGVQEGAKLMVDGRTFSSEKGYFLGASLFDHVKPQMKIYQEEIFGPVLCVVRVDNLQSAIALVNAHEFGNGTAIFTNDGNTAHLFSHQVQVGMVGINVPIPVPVAYHSFGGWKRSLFGDIHMHGEEGVQFYTKLKTITQRWIKDAKKGPEFVMPTH